MDPGRLVFSPAPWVASFRHGSVELGAALLWAATPPGEFARPGGPNASWGVVFGPWCRPFKLRCNLHVGGPLKHTNKRTHKQTYAPKPPQRPQVALLRGPNRVFYGDGLYPTKRLPWDLRGTIGVLTCPRRIDLLTT